LLAPPYIGAAVGATVPTSVVVIYAVGTYDGSALKLYLNGSLVGTATTSVSIVYSDSYPLLLGYYANAFATNMSIGSLKLYNRALSDTEIQQNFNAMHERYNI
jgi:hypothetical protein